eukprot:2853145-Alexandrium_andersonii.AAC.1
MLPTRAPEAPREARRLRRQALALGRSRFPLSSGPGEGHFALLARSARSLSLLDFGPRPWFAIAMY